MARMSWTTIRIALGSIALVISATACRNAFSTDDGTHIRLRNSSSFELTSVTFSPGQAELKFDRIRPGETTGYVPVANAYRYGYLDLLVDGTRRTLQPIDYVGESFIGDGRFTYVITVEPTTRAPRIELIED